MINISLKFKGTVVSETPLTSGVITVGRDSGNDIQIDNPAISGIHARISMKGGKVYIEDSISTNGTFLNGKKIDQAVITYSDEIMIGKHTISIEKIEGEGAVSENKPTSPVIPSLDQTMVIDSRKQEKPINKTVEPEGSLSLISGPGEKESYDLTDRVTTIGKSIDAQIKIKGFFAPKVAALINKTDKGYTLTPTSKWFPPKVNGSTLSQPHLMQDNDRLEIKGITMQFQLKDNCQHE